MPRRRCRRWGRLQTQTELRSLARRSPAVRPGSSLATDRYQSAAQGLGTPAPIHSGVWQFGKTEKKNAVERNIPFVGTPEATSQRGTSAPGEFSGAGSLPRRSGRLAPETRGRREESAWSSVSTPPAPEGPALGRARAPGLRLAPPCLVGGSWSHPLGDSDRGPLKPAAASASLFPPGVTPSPALGPVLVKLNY